MLKYMAAFTKVNQQNLIEIILDIHMDVSEHITDYDIQALVDGELAWEDAKRVKDYLRQNRDAQMRYQQLEDQKKALQRWGRLNTH